MNLPDSWVVARLGDFLTRVETKVDPQTSLSESHFYVGLEHIQSHTGKLLRDTEEVTEGSEILSIKTAFQAGDILYGKLRPNLNKVYLAKQEGICSTDIWALRTAECLLPEFALRYLRSPSFYVRATQLAAGANLPRLSADSFDRLPIPLPTLPEQQRIVTILEQVEAVYEAKKSISVQLENLIRTAYWEYFGDWYTANALKDPVRIRDVLTDTQYGVSEVMGETGEYAVLRMNSMTTSGWLDLTDLKFADLSDKDIKSTELRDGDLLFNRTNSRELVGKCAIWRPVDGKFSFASYLVRLRLKPEMVPEYLWATLNSAYGKYRLFNAAKQAVSMSNVSPTDLGRIAVPLPPLPLQQKFAKLVREIEALRFQMFSKLELYSELQSSVINQAITGKLTAKYRDEHAKEISAAVDIRDTLLSKNGTSITLSANTVATPSSRTESIVRPARHWLQTELSEFQRQVLLAFTEYCQQSDQQFLIEDPEIFGRFCDDSIVLGRLKVFGQWHETRIRRSLNQLAALGLIAKITVLRQASNSDEMDYLAAFRLLRPQEFTRMSDVQDLRKALISDVGKQKYYFQVLLDYETSERAGAVGMFQVISVEDDDGKNYTDLVDQGKHYTSLDELKKYIASTLKVEARQIELEEI